MWFNYIELYCNYSVQCLTTCILYLDKIDDIYINKIIYLSIVYKEKSALVIALLLQIRHIDYLALNWYTIVNIVTFADTIVLLEQFWSFYFSLFQLSKRLSYANIYYSLIIKIQFNLI